MPVKYANASLDPKLVKSLKRVHKEKLSPLGVTYSHPSVIRYLVKHYDLTSALHHDLISDAMKDWQESGDE